MRGFSRVRGLVCAAAVVAFITYSVGAGAGRPPVAVGEVKSQVPAKARDAEVRDVLMQEFAQLDMSRVHARDRYVLSASLVRLETHTVDGQAKSSCVVSAVLRKDRGGALHAILQGRARASDTPSQAREVELSALRGAVRSALKRVPEALR